MHSEIKIPTLLGLSVLVVGLIFGVYLVVKNPTNFFTRANISNAPTNSAVVNISTNTASIFWQTQDSSSGFIQLGTTKSLSMTYRDDRDSKGPQNHSLHFVTLDNLSPNTTYYYKINSAGIAYPSGEPLSFKTSSNVPGLGYQPIIGTIIDTNFHPVDEAIIVLNTPEAQQLATISKVAGNFILPLTDIKQTDLTTPFNLTKFKPIATLTIISPKQTSRVTIKLPLQNPTLKPIVLGQDLDLVPQESSSSTTFPPGDINHDGVVNSLDR